jgi:predicted amidophosphoribosyltransferase
MHTLLPVTCASCDTLLSSPAHLCAACFARLTFITRPYCAHCGVPFRARGEAGRFQLCPACDAAPPRFARARAALRYDQAAKALILPLKHADRLELAAVLAPMMRQAGTELLAGAALLVPVPLHRARLRQRRYHQAALLARAISRDSGKPVLLDALQRLRPTPALGELGAEQRAMAVQGCFAVNPRRRAALAGQPVLLIDDVLTSGATANACAEALLAAGVAAVDVLAAARVPDPRLQRGLNWGPNMPHG